MMGAVGELERNTIVDNVKMGMKQRAKTGRHNGKLPLGYQALTDPSDPSGRSKQVVIVDSDASIVLKIFELYAAGRGLKSIANELNHSSYKTKTGNTFSTSAIKEILNNPFYNGKIRCPECGSAMVASRTSSKTKTGAIRSYLHYACGAFRSKGSSVCSANSIQKQVAEDEVMKRLAKVLSEKHILTVIVDRMNHKLTTRTVPLQSELSHIRSQLEQAVNKKRRYLDLFEQGNVDKSLFSGRMQEIQSQIINLHVEQSRLELEITADNKSPVDFKQVHELIYGFNQVLTTAPFEHRKTLLHLFIKRITMTANKQIETIELSFDENVDSFFSPPSIAATTETFQSQLIRKREKIEIAI